MINIEYKIQLSVEKMERSGWISENDMEHFNRSLQRRQGTQRIEKEDNPTEEEDRWDWRMKT